MRSDLLASPTQLSRFTGEAKALASLQHPNVVQLFQVGEADGQPYLVMHHVAGAMLRQSMRSGPWKTTAAAQLIRTLADADCCRSSPGYHPPRSEAGQHPPGKCGMRSAECGIEARQAARIIAY
ncbi:MAG: protein kinase [Gemmataceae bacterium]